MHGWVEEDLTRRDVAVTPYTFVPSDTLIFDPRRARIAHPKTAAQRAELLDCDDPIEMDKEVSGKSPKPLRRDDD
jgi:hypothetical protein